jgi:hypothetical protein
MLDEEHHSFPQPPDGTDVYTVGRMGDHNVVIGCLPEGQMGTNSAAAMAVRMESEFTSLRSAGTSLENFEVII